MVKPELALGQAFVCHEAGTLQGCDLMPYGQTLGLWGFVYVIANTSGDQEPRCTDKHMWTTKVKIKVSREGS